MRLLRLIRKAGTPEGCRESTRLSYDQHLTGALKGNGASGDAPHHTALYGALASWYNVRGVPIREAMIWGELAPFLLVPEAEAREAIAEYTVYLETPAQANVAWLAGLVNDALRPVPVSKESPRSMAFFGAMYGAAWYKLLASDVKETVDAEVRSLMQKLREGAGA
jgi:hypothetical protein